ncbi:MAG: hypothetical protein U5L46_03270 [Agrobacterium sp.]|nr:hypothetical protein [Agrobacterium sp.]
MGHVSSYFSNQWVVLFAILTSIGVTGTSVSTPTTVAKVAPDRVRKREMATATESSKKLEAPITPPGAATQCGSFHSFFDQKIGDEEDQVGLRRISGTAIRRIRRGLSNNHLPLKRKDDAPRVSKQAVDGDVGRIWG